MALLHQATLTPGKRELMGAWLPSRSWYDGRSPRPVGSFRLDDPAGEVGCEFFLLGDEDPGPLFVPLSYRGAPLEGAEEHLVGVMEHSVLGTRWVYDGCADPVAVSVLMTAIHTGGHEALLEIEHDGSMVRLDPTCRVEGSGAADTRLAVEAVTVLDHGNPTRVAAGDHELLVARVVGTPLAGAEHLTARWGEAAHGVVAALSPIHRSSP